ncbi:VWA domain-containing protein, partial [Actinoplanes sp. GCM10030250]|uniref:VWA domain-containing protein n=1 Tax=Actinoplanes sp. GCM10030250 TaxID=3273376 RepID=UPI003615B204
MNRRSLLLIVFLLVLAGSVLAGVAGWLSWPLVLVLAAAGLGAGVFLLTRKAAPSEGFASAPPEPRAQSSRPEPLTTGAPPAQQAAAPPPAPARGAAPPPPARRAAPPPPVASAPPAARRPAGDPDFPDPTVEAPQRRVWGAAEPADAGFEPPQRRVLRGSAPASVPPPRSPRRRVDPPLSPPGGYTEASAGDYAAPDEGGIDGAFTGSPLNPPDFVGALRVGGGVLSGGPGNVPMAGRSEPLPHDGLFIRRNNAFGTRLTHGVKDLIDEGVMVDQERIRFDDFVAGNIDDLAAPADGSAVAVRHGWTAAIGNVKAQPGTTHFLEIALRAADAPGRAGRHAAPLPVNIVFAVDTSSSMSGEKIDSVKAAILGLYDQLRDDDVLGIVSFDTQARTVMRATRRSGITADDLATLVGRLAPQGSTDLNMGVSYGLDELSRHGGDEAIASHLYLFSDGEPTSGETNWIKIRTNIAGRTRGDVTLSCFGFGFDAQMRELDALAGLTGGQSTFVTDPDTVRLSLAEDQTRREHLAAINLQLKIEIPGEVTVWHLYGHDLISDPASRRAVELEARDAGRRGLEQFNVAPMPDLITHDTGIRIFAPDLAYGEAYWVVLEVQVPQEGTASGPGEATVQFLDVGNRENHRRHLRFDEAPTIPESVVQAHAIGLWTSEVTFYALDDLYADDRAAAKQRLRNHADSLRTAFEHVPANQFRDDRVTILKLVSLADNLGQPRRWHDSGGSSGWSSAVHVMNRFGMVRNGFHR